MRFKVERDEPLFGGSAMRYYRGRSMRRLALRGVTELRGRLYDYHVPSELGVGVGDEIEVAVDKMVPGRDGWILIIGRIGSGRAERY